MSTTLLSIVQSYLDRTDGFYVEDINEVDEAMQVASIAEEVFENMYTYIRNPEFSSKLLTLEGLGDTSKPNYLKLSDNTIRMHESRLQYNVSSDALGLDYRDIQYINPQDFLTLHKSITAEDTTYIVVQDFSNAKFSVRTNKDPEFFTSFDGVHLVFDSYNAEKEDTLHESNTRLHGSEGPTFLKQSSFVIPLPKDIIPLYRDLVLVECYESLRQEPAPSIVQKRARTGTIKLQQEARRIGSAGRTRKFGR